MRKVWVRRKIKAGTEDPVEWAPAVVVREDDCPGSEDFSLTVQIESWEELNRRARKKTESDSDSDSEEEEGAGSVDEDALVKAAAEDVLERNEWTFPPDDLVQLVHLHEPAILQALCERFWESTIYTWCGPILLALNPFERLALYQKSILDHYRYERKKTDQNEECNDPHVYAVAASAYSCLVDKSGTDGGDMDQSILISGESGAGKTESTKIVMQYLATVARRPREDGSEQREELHVSEYLSASGDGEKPVVKEINVKDYSIEQQVLESNPILEAFGNARTIRNDNSSRFGKFIQIQFDDRGYLVGATISSYLLEKVRIIHQGENERGYHVFYQMLYGGSEAEKETWRFTEDDEPADFDYLNSGGCYDRRDGVDDATQLQVTQRAMDIMGLSKEEAASVFALVAGVAHMGNLVFIEDSSRTTKAVGSKETTHGSTIDVETESSAKALEAVEQLFGLSRESIIKALCNRNVNAGGEVFEVPLAPEEAADTRDALAKSAYSRAFDWLVSRVNECIRSKSKVKRFIGVLDIFGFEIFKHNSFEQLCINYANERLQQQFNDFVFKHEQSIYAKEKISWSFIDFPSNASTVELIDGSKSTLANGQVAAQQTPTATSSGQMGILAILDDECRLPNGNDQGFVRKLYESCESRDRFSASKAQRPRGEFVVRHYAGEVVYNSEGFCSKNKDALRQEAVDLMTSSSAPFVKQLFTEGESGDTKGKKTPKRQQSSGADKQRRSAISLVSVGAEFKRQLGNLIDTISSTAPHYIRCIKPNDIAKAKHIVRGRVVAQLRCGGVLEAVRVARAGFPIRMPHKVFIARYGRVVGPTAIQFLFSRTLPKAQIKITKEVLETIPKTSQLEKKEARTIAMHVADILRECNSADDIDSMLQIGKTKVFMRKIGHDLIERHLSRWKRYAAQKVSASIVGNFSKVRFQRVRSAVLSLQCMARVKIAKRQAKDIRWLNASVKLQAWIRSVFFTKAFRTIRGAVISIQCAERGRKDRILARERKIERARMRLQKWSRGYRTRREFLDKRKCVVKIQCALRSSAARAHVRELKREARDLGAVLRERDALREQVQELKKQLSNRIAGGTFETMEGDFVSESPSDAKKNPTSGTFLITPDIRRRMILLGGAAYVTTILWKNFHRFRREHFTQCDLSSKTNADSPVTSHIIVPSLEESDETFCESVGIGNGEHSEIEKSDMSDWYTRTFGEELLKLNQATLTASPTVERERKKIAPSQQQSSLQKDEQIKLAEEFRIWKERNGAKRLELEAGEKKLMDEHLNKSAAAAAEGELNDMLEELRVMLEQSNATVQEKEEELSALIKEFEGHKKGILGQHLEDMARLEAEHKTALLEQMDKVAAIENEKVEAQQQYEEILASLREELESSKSYVGNLTGLKNHADIKQGELELRISALKEQLSKAEEEAGSLAAERDDLRESMERMKTDIAVNKDIAKSAAVIQLENEIRAAHSEADELKDRLGKTSTENERLKKDNEMKQVAIQDLNDSSIKKLNTLQRDLVALSRAKAKSEGYLKARILIDRRSRRVAQFVMNVWRQHVLENKALRQKVNAVRRTFLRRRVAKYFKTWSAVSRKEMFQETLVNRWIERSSTHLIRKAFTGWASVTRRSYRTDLLDAKLNLHANSLVASKVLYAWRQYATLRAEENHLFEMLLGIFRLNKLRRHLRVWHGYARQAVRLDILLSSYQSNDRRRKISKVFAAWAQEMWRGRVATVDLNLSVQSDEAQKNTLEKKEDYGLAKSLIRKLAEQDARITALQKGRDDDTLSLPGELLQFSPRVEVLSEEDSFYSPGPDSRSSLLNSQRSKSERFRSKGDFSYQTPVEERNQNIFFSGRKSLGSARQLRFDDDGSPRRLSHVPRSPLWSANDELSFNRRASGFIDQEGSDLLVAYSGGEILSPLPMDLEAIIRTAETVRTTPLILAAQHGQLEAVKDLIASGHNVNETDHRKQSTALHAAIQGHQWSQDGTERIVETLLESDADVHAKNNIGNTPLMEAAMLGDEGFEVTKALIRHGALSKQSSEKMNANGQTPLHSAVRIGAVKTTHLLLENGASLTESDSQGQNALHHAARFCNVMMLENLLGFWTLNNASQKGPRFIDLQDAKGDTALHIVCASTSVDMARAVYVLIENEANPNIRNSAGQVPIHLLASNNCKQTVSALKYFSMKCDFHAKDLNGNTALHMACQLNVREIARELVNLGAPLYVPNARNETPLDIVSPGFAVELLLTIKSQPDETMARGAQREITKCMVCKRGFAYFSQQQLCSHCGRICCARCTKKKVPILKFDPEKTFVSCDHCFRILFMPRDRLPQPEDVGVGDLRTALVSTNS